MKYNKCGDPKFRPSGGESVQVLFLEQEPCDVGACAVDETCVPCGRPASRAPGSPVATDALMILSGAGGANPCGSCLCDVDSDGSVTASDALAILFEVVGLPAGDAPICLKYD